MLLITKDKQAINQLVQAISQICQCKKKQEIIPILTDLEPLVSTQLNNISKDSLQDNSSLQEKIHLLKTWTRDSVLYLWQAILQKIWSHKT